MGSNPFKVTQCLCTSVGSSAQLVSWRIRGFKPFQSDTMSLYFSGSSAQLVSWRFRGFKSFQSDTMSVDEKQIIW